MKGIIKHVILSNIRYPKNLLFNMLFPIFLMLLIGGVLFNDFDNVAKIEPFNVYYYDLGTQESKKILAEAIRNKGSIKAEFKKVNSLEEGKERVKLGEDVFIFLDENTIKVYSNNKYLINGGMINGLLESINRKISLENEVGKLNNNEIKYNLEKNNDRENVVFDKVEQKRAQTSFDYYGVVEITMMASYLLFFSMYGIQRDKRLESKNRIMITNISPSKYYIAKLIGYFILGNLIILPGYLFARFIFKVNFGSYPILAYVGIISLAMMFISLGILIGGISNEKNDGLSKLLYSIIFPVMSFLGGCYISFPDEGGFKSASLSPLRWTNLGIFKMANSNDYSVIKIAILLDVILSIIFLCMLNRYARREEAI